MSIPGYTPPDQKHSLGREKIRYWSVISALSVTFTVRVESVTVLQEVTDLRVSEESEPVTQWLRLTALQAGVLIEMLWRKF